MFTPVELAVPDKMLIMARMAAAMTLK